MKGLDNLKKLNLSNNPINIIPDDFFEMMLHTDIIGSKIIELKAQKLENYLTNWVQSNNTKKFKTAKSIILECLKERFENLDLSGLGLTSIPSKEIFKYLTHIRKLNLYGNKISKIEGDEFENLKKLEELNLFCNKITEIGKLKGLDNLEKLSLFAG